MNNNRESEPPLISLVIILFMITSFLMIKNSNGLLLNIQQQDAHINDFSPSQVNFESGYESPLLITNNNSESEPAGCGILDNHPHYQVPMTGTSLIVDTNTTDEIGTTQVGCESPPWAMNNNIRPESVDYKSLLVIINKNQEPESTAHESPSVITNSNREPEFATRESPLLIINNNQESKSAARESPLLIINNNREPESIGSGILNHHSPFQEPIAGTPLRDTTEGKDTTQIGCECE